MPLTNTILQTESQSNTNLTDASLRQNQIPARLPNVKAGVRQAGLPARYTSATPATRQENGHNFQTRPVITGEATVRGIMSIDGVIAGQMSANGGALNIRLRTRSVTSDSTPEVEGEISFKDMLRINGHVAGKVLSPKGTLIVDAAARVDADIEVGVAVISGTVNGDVIAYQRLELGPVAIINGSIATRALEMKPGAVFHGDCRMLKREEH